jgi:hypothetical protein
LKKNPFMSMWLNGANAAAGSLRSRATAQARRHATAAMLRATRDIVDFWTLGLVEPPAKIRRRKRR